MVRLVVGSDDGGGKTGADRDQGSGNTLSPLDRAVQYDKGLE